MVIEMQDLRRREATRPVHPSGLPSKFDLGLLRHVAWGVDERAIGLLEAKNFAAEGINPRDVDQVEARLVNLYRRLGVTNGFEAIQQAVIFGFTTYSELTKGFNWEETKPLSPRSYQILKLIADSGDTLTREQVADKLKIGAATVKSYLGRAYDKLNLHAEGNNTHASHIRALVLVMAAEEQQRNIINLPEANPTLNEDQLAIFRLKLQGFTEPQIAEQLGKTLPSVKKQVVRIREILGTESSIAAVDVALEKGILTIEEILAMGYQPDKLTELSEQEYDILESYAIFGDMTREELEKNFNLTMTVDSVWRLIERKLGVRTAFESGVLFLLAKHIALREETNGVLGDETKKEAIINPQGSEEVERARAFIRGTGVGIIMIDDQGVTRLLAAAPNSDILVHAWETPIYGITSDGVTGLIGIEDGAEKYVQVRTERRKIITLVVLDGSLRRRKQYKPQTEELLEKI